MRSYASVCLRARIRNAGLGAAPPRHGWKHGGFDSEAPSDIWTLRVELQRARGEKAAPHNAAHAPRADIHEKVCTYCVQARA